MRKKNGIPSDTVAESPGIGLYAESSLHASVKQALCGEGDRQEVKLEGRIVDILRADGEVVEVQTGNFGKLRAKVLALSRAGLRVRVVLPIASTKYIVQLDPGDGSPLSRRKSPKRGSALSLFDELIHFPELLALPGIRLSLLFMEVEELRCPDGKGSWRRRFQTILDRRMTLQGESLDFKAPEDLLKLLPPKIPSASPGVFTSAELARALSCKPEQARRALYCLRHLGLAKEAGKSGRSILWTLGGRKKRGKKGS